MIYSEKTTNSVFRNNLTNYSKTGSIREDVINNLQTLKLKQDELKQEQENNDNFISEKETEIEKQSKKNDKYDNIYDRLYSKANTVGSPLFAGSILLFFPFPLIGTVGLSILAVYVVGTAIIKTASDKGKEYICHTKDEIIKLHNRQYKIGEEKITIEKQIKQLEKQSKAIEWVIDAAEISKEQDAKDSKPITESDGYLIIGGLKVERRKDDECNTRQAVKE